MTQQQSMFEPYPQLQRRCSLFFFDQNCWYFHFSTKMYVVGYSLEMPCFGASNEYSQHVFSWKNKKNLFLIPTLVWSYAYAPDKRKYQIFYQDFLFFISPWKHMLWVLIRSASVRHFYWVSQHMFLQRERKISTIFGWKKEEKTLYLELWYSLEICYNLIKFKTAGPVDVFSFHNIMPH